MIEKYEDVPGWVFQLDEISANVYEIVGKDKSGHCIREVGVNLESIIDKCKKKAQDINIDQRGVRLSQVVHSSECKSHPGKVGQPPSSNHRAGGSNPKC